MKLVPCYINLDSRTDRKEQTEGEFKKLDIQEYIRFPAIYNKNGEIGCLESHIKILESYDIDSPAIWICEDDIKFLVNKDILNQYINEFLDSSGDILCLGFSSRSHKAYSGELLRTFDTQTTSSYIVKAEFRKVLLDFWKLLLLSINEKKEHPAKSIYRFLPVVRGKFEAADQSWKVLQQDYMFLIPNKKVLIQRAGYSDIEKCHVAYNT